MASLFDDVERRNLAQALPLAARMRPRTLQEFVGQQHFLGPGRLLRRMLEADRLSSVVFYGPPGTGKTTLAHVIAGHTKSEFVALNAAASSVKEVREALDAARDRLAGAGRRTAIFIDELHRFNRAQQDVLLPDVESGVVMLIGATTQNPFFAINSPLLSRSQIFQFEPLTRHDIKTVMQRALADRERGLGNFDVHLTDEACEFLAEVSDGDARRVLNALEVGVLSAPSQPVQYDLELAKDCIQRKLLEFDRTGDAHYDLASAFIKSMRGSDPDAAIYWMARMLEAGEEPRFIARRIVICAAEDVGNADPLALVVANAALQVSEFVGLPECQLPLSQAVTYISCAPKSNAATVAISEARRDVREQRTVVVPRHLQDASYPGAKRLGRGDGYKYSHDFENGWVDQDYLGVEKCYYRPVERGIEAEIKQRLEAMRGTRQQPEAPIDTEVSCDTASTSSEEKTT
jgi:putative ATPase